MRVVSFAAYRNPGSRRACAGGGFGHPQAMAALRILVADPDERSREELLHWLQDAGYEVVTATTGTGAIAQLKTSHFDVVITEVLLPDRDGLDVIKFSRQSQLHQRLIAISGGGSYLTRLDCLKLAKMLGAHAVALKPLNQPQLLTALHGAQAAEHGAEHAHPSA